MTIAVIVIAFLLDQIRSSGSDSAAAGLLRRWIRAVTGHVDAGGRQHAWFTWLLAVGAPALVVGVIGWLCTRVTGWFGQLAWSVAVLYFTLGFRQFSYRYTAIRDALAAGDEAKARALLAQWQDEEVGPLPRGATAQGLIARGVIAHAVLSAHRCVFGVLFWFCLLTPLGLAPAGAVLYRHADFVVRYWRHKAKKGELAASPALLSVAQTAWFVVDWLPARMTALAFAVVGNFEAAIDAWRRRAAAAGEAQDNDAIVLAAAAGALGIRLDDGLNDSLRDSLRDDPAHPANAKAGGQVDPAGAPSAPPDPPSSASLAHADAADGYPPTAIEPPPPPDWAPAEDAASLPGGESDTADGMADAGAFDSISPDARHFVQVAGLLWRSVALWLLMLVLLTLAHVLG